MPIQGSLASMSVVSFRSASARVPSRRSLNDANLGFGDGNDNPGRRESGTGVREEGGAQST